VTFSIVFPTYNRAELTKQCVTTTLKNTGISRDRLEIVWVDDGSSDKKVHQVMKEFDPDISILKKHNQGTIKTKNMGFVLSTGDWICLIDSDIEMPAGWIVELEKYINAIPELKAVCFSDVNRSRWGGDFITCNGLKLQQMKVNLMSGAYAFSRDVLYNVGYLDEEFGFYGNNDAEFTCRLAKAKYLYGYIPSIEGSRVSLSNHVLKCVTSVF